MKVEITEFRVYMSHICCSSELDAHKTSDIWQETLVKDGHHKYMCYNGDWNTCSKYRHHIDFKVKHNCNDLSKYFQGNKKLHFDFLLRFSISTLSTVEPKLTLFVIHKAV